MSIQPFSSTDSTPAVEEIRRVEALPTFLVTRLHRVICSVARSFDRSNKAASASVFPSEDPAAAGPKKGVLSFIFRHDHRVWIEHSTKTATRRNSSSSSLSIPQAPVTATAGETIDTDILTQSTPISSVSSFDGLTGMGKHMTPTSASLRGVTRQLNILVVDGCSRSRKRLFSQLSRSGHHIALAGLGLDFLSMIEQAKSMEINLDVILMDTSYGETCATIRALGYKNALFGLMDPEEAFLDIEAQASLSEGFDAVLLKPLNTRVFLEELALYDAMKQAKEVLVPHFGCCDNHNGSA